jgi:hypothetical protein
MSSQVFYRKWRPQTLSEVVGQQHVTETLRRSIVNGRVAHAYLFCGPRGTGKTSTGRILAKAINCLEPVNGEPCNNCALCQAFNAGSALDIIEIDAASNRGIDEIRELKERVNYAPAAAKYKVYIRASAPCHLCTGNHRPAQSAGYDIVTLPAFRLSPSIPVGGHLQAGVCLREGRHKNRAGRAEVDSQGKHRQPARCGKPAGTTGGLFRT